MSPAGSHQLFNTMTGAPPPRTDPMTGPATTDQDFASASIATESMLRSNNQLTNNQLTTTNDSTLVARAAKQSNKSTPYTDKWCTYCKKRVHTYKGHTWQQCRPLKKDTDKKTSVETQNHAFVTHAQTVVSLPHQYNWKFDTCARRQI